MWQIQLGNQKAHIKWHYSPCLGSCWSWCCCCSTCPNKRQKPGPKLCICIRLPPCQQPQLPFALCPLHCFLALFQLRRCGFNLQFAAAVIWQIVCRKNKRRRRSSLAPTIQQLRRRRRGADFGRGQFILPGTMLLQPVCLVCRFHCSCSDSCAGCGPPLLLPAFFATTPSLLFTPCLPHKG